MNNRNNRSRGPIHHAWRIDSQAIRDTKDWLLGSGGGATRTVFIASVCVVVGSGLFWCVHGFQAMMSQIMVWAAYAAIPYALLALVVWAYCAFIAPYRLHREIQAEADRLEMENSELKGDLQEATKASRSALEIQYDSDCHFTRHPNGRVDVRIVVKNTGEKRARRVRVKVESLVPLTNKRKAGSYSTQFCALRLQVVREKTGFSLHAGDLAEVILLRAEKDGEYYFVPGYDEEEREEDFLIPREKYRMTITASAMDANPDTKVFIVTPRRNGEIAFARDETSAGSA